MTVSLPKNGLVLFSCEGGFENVAVKKLLDAGMLVIEWKNVVGITSDRSVPDIQRDYLGFDYGEKPLTIIRVVDSLGKRFQLGRLYRDHSSVVHRRTTSTPGSPAVEISPGDTEKIKKQKIHFILEE